MAGLRSKRVFTIIAILFTGISTSNAQDVHVFLAADHVRTFTQPYLSPSGGTLGLRFPVKRVAVELALSHARIGNGPITDVERRTAGMLSLLYGFRLSKSWYCEAGAEGGYASRFIYRAGAVDYSLYPEFIPVSAVLSFRYVRGQWVQPFLAFHPTYDHMIQNSWGYGELYYSSSFLLIIRAGVSFALPSDPERGK